MLLSFSPLNYLNAISKALFVIWFSDDARIDEKIVVETSEANKKGRRASQGKGNLLISTSQILVLVSSESN